MPSSQEEKIVLKILNINANYYEIKEKKTIQLAKKYQAKYEKI